MFSTKLLSEWLFPVLIAGTLLVFILSRLLACVAARAGSDRYWQKPKKKRLTKDLKSMLVKAYSQPGASVTNETKPSVQNNVTTDANPSPAESTPDAQRHPPAAAQANAAESNPPGLTSPGEIHELPGEQVLEPSSEVVANHKLPDLSELYRRIDIDIKRTWPAKMNERQIANECTQLIATCEERVMLWRLQKIIDDVNEQQERNEKKATQTIDPDRRLIRRLRLVEKVVLTLYVALLLLVVPAVDFWANSPGPIFALWSAVAIIVVGTVGVLAAWAVLPR